MSTRARSAVSVGLESDSFSAATRPGEAMLFRQDALDGIREGHITVAFGDDEMAVLSAKLAKLDASAPGGPWTRRVLQLIRDNPAIRAGDLCKVVEMERLPFKANVRKLKALGLTESLEVGYRLSPRGEALLSGGGEF